MFDTILLFSLLLLSSSLTLLLICLNTYYLKREQLRKLAILPQTLFPEELSQLPTTPKVRILAFSTSNCRQCRLLQTPVLQRIKEAHGDEVVIVEVQAISSPELIDYFHVDTFPSTALFDAQDHLHAINYGFASAQCLLKQVEELIQLYPSLQQSPQKG
jgi:Thioredoxin